MPRSSGCGTVVPSEPCPSWLESPRIVATFQSMHHCFLRLPQTSLCTQHASYMNQAYEQTVSEGNMQCMGRKSRQSSEEASRDRRGRGCRSKCGKITAVVDTGGSWYRACGIGGWEVVLVTTSLSKAMPWVSQLQPMHHAVPSAAAAAATRAPSHRVLAAAAAV